MKIVHVVYSLEMGGAEVLVAQLARLQREHGHDVSLCAYALLGTVGEALAAEGFPIYTPGEAHPVRTMLRYLRHFRRLRPDVVHCHNPAPTLQAALPARLAGARRVLATRHSLVAPPYDRPAEIKFNLIARACHAIVGICDVTCTNLRGTPLAQPRKIVRVYNGADPITPAAPSGAPHLEAEMWEPSPDTPGAPSIAALRDGWAEPGPGAPDLSHDTPGAPSIAASRDGWDVQRPDPGEPHPFTLLFVGRLATIKDLPTLLRATALAAQTLPHLRLWVVGDGPARDALESLANDLDLAARVTFFGQRLDTPAFFSAADAFVMSSTSEGLPMSLLQAMSLGLPAILTNVGGMAEVVHLADSGLLAPVGDAEAYAAAILRLASDPNLRQELSANALTAYTQHFTLAQMDAAYMALYRGYRVGYLSHQAHP